MSKTHTIYLIYRDGVFFDACLSYSEASRIMSTNGPGRWTTRSRSAEDY